MLVICLTSRLVAQSPTSDSPVKPVGVVVASDFPMAPADTSVDAEVLFDVGEVRFETDLLGFQMVFTRHRRMRILKASGTGHGNWQLTLKATTGSTNETLETMQGFTHNLVNGAVETETVRLDDVLTDTFNDKFTTKKLSLPAVRAGSIIEFAYKVRTPFLVSYNPRPWLFQEGIPVRWSEYRLTIPGHLRYKSLFSGRLRFAVEENRPATVQLSLKEPPASAIAYRFAVANAPAFPVEPFVPALLEHVSRLEFELASVNGPTGVLKDFSITWGALDKSLLEFPWFGGQLRKTAFLRDLAASIRSKHPIDELARLTAAYEYVRTTIKWNGRDALGSENIKQVLDNRQGDAADINLLLIGLLRELDIAADPVVLSTRSHGKLAEKEAMLQHLNYVVAQVTVQNKTLFLDATDPYVAPGMLPFRCLNQVGRSIPTKQPGQFVSLRPNALNEEHLTGTFTLDGDGNAKGHLIHRASGYAGWPIRSGVLRDGKPKFISTLATGHPAWQLLQTDILNADHPDSVVVLNHTILCRDIYSEQGDRLFLQPLLTEGLTINPFRETKRRYPIDFGVGSKQEYAFTITLPTGYVVEHIPEPLSLTLPDEGGRFDYQISQANNTLIIKSLLSLPKPIYPREEYLELRDFFVQAIAKHAERIVLKRAELTKKK